MKSNPLVEAIYALANDTEVGWNTDPLVRNLVLTMRREQIPTTGRYFGHICLTGVGHEQGDKPYES